MLYEIRLLDHEESFEIEADTVRAALEEFTESSFKDAFWTDIADEKNEVRVSVHNDAGRWNYFNITLLDEDTLEYRISRGRRYR
jgi:hypothetical protein